MSLQAARWGDSDEKPPYGFDVALLRGEQLGILLDDLSYSCACLRAVESPEVEHRCQFAWIERGQCQRNLGQRHRWDICPYHGRRRNVAGGNRLRWRETRLPRRICRRREDRLPVFVRRRK